MQRNNEGLQSTNRTNENEESSSVSNLTLSYSEVSEGEICKDVLEELCQRESLKMIKENLENVKNLNRNSRVWAGEMDVEIAEMMEKVKEVEGKVAQKMNEVSCVETRVLACRDLLCKAEQELIQTFHSFDSDQTSKMNHELKQKYMSICRSSEIIKKKLSTLISKNQELDKILQNKESNLETLRSELETLKHHQKKLEDNTELTLLEINKDVLISQLNPNTVFNQKTVENLHKELLLQFKQLNSSSQENLSEKICDLIETTKQKIFEFDYKNTKLTKKFNSVKSEILSNFEKSKQDLIEKFDNLKVSQIRALADEYRIKKSIIRDELQKEKMYESKFLVSESNYEEIVEMYRVMFM